MMMPGMDGLSTFDRLQADESTRDIPVILFTAKVQVGDRQAWEGRADPRRHRQALRPDDARRSGRGDAQLGKGGLTRGRVAPREVDILPAVKTVLLVVVAAVGAVIAKRKIDEGRAEQALWAEATDSVKRS